MGNAYIHRTISDKPDIDSVLEKEEPIGVGTEFTQSANVVDTSVEPKVVFMYDSFREELYVRTMVALDVTLVADGFASGGILSMSVDRVNNIVFFSVFGTLSPWVANGIYKFSYDPDTGLPTTGFVLILTATLANQALFAAGSKLYYNAVGSGTSIHRMNYDGTGSETVSGVVGNPKGIWVSSDNTKLWIGDTGIGTILSVDLTLSFPVSSVIEFREDSPVFGSSTFYDWGQIFIDQGLGEIFMTTGGGGSGDAYKPTQMRHAVWPNMPPTPTSHPPAYSTHMTKEYGSGGFSFDFDLAKQWLFMYNNVDQVLYRYNYRNLLMEDETFIVDLSTSALGALNNISYMRLG